MRLLYPAIIILLGMVILIVAPGRHPSVPVRIAPEGLVHADTNVLFAWHPVRGAVQYTIDVVGPDSVPMASAATLGDTTVEMSALWITRGVRYAWTVTAIDSKGRGSQSKPVAFTVMK